ncbi:restriction endonuclease subunit S [Leucobacter allii]|uniref:Restriction endonuclease subunit S n=1 Tax=Leucobacter allii TaxID=2932247 RepID=A0ABY4FGU3_9MICO|nr:restriction endonuclease subunit S [Leucobacter allii]UOQ55885.1 restriction endonuclease subunit S [Leucobacter allii]
MNREPLRAVATERGLVGGPFGSSLVNADYTHDGVPVIRGVNMSAGRFVGGEFAFVSLEKLARDLAHNTAVPRDIIYTQRGTLGQVALVPSGGAETFVISQSQMRLRVDPERAVPEFVYYASTTNDFLGQIDDRAISTGVPHTNLGILAELEIPLPSLAEQQAIAEVLGALDDKIAANTALAGAVDDYLATLLDDMAGGVGTTMLRSIADVNRRSVKPDAEGNLRYVDIASVTVGSFEYPEISAWSDAPGRARRGLSAGDTMWSTVRPNRRSHALNLEDDALLVASTGLAILSPREVGFAYLYEASRRPEFSAYLENVAEGSAYPAVRADRFLEAPVPSLSADHIHTFEAQAAPLRELVASLARENRTLAATRDALLPQLMSGKLRVRDAEAEVSEAGV